MNQETKTVLANMRHKARTTPETVHVYSTAEKAIHTTAISDESTKHNSQCTLIQSGMVCFCEPEFEDYTDRGGGLLVLHRSVRWQ